MTLEDLMERVENGTCPFTGKVYNCARCKCKPELRELGEGMRTLHICLCITQPLMLAPVLAVKNLVIVQWLPINVNCKRDAVINEVGLL